MGREWDGTGMGWDVGVSVLAMVQEGANKLNWTILN